MHKTAVVCTTRFHREYQSDLEGREGQALAYASVRSVRNPPWCCHQKRSYSVWRNWNFATSFSCLWTVPWEYVKGHARSVSNLHSASAAPLSFRSLHLPAVLDYCLDRNDFHGVSRAEGPSQLTWMMSLNRLWLIVFQIAPDSGLVSRCRHGRGMADLPTHVPPNTPFSACLLWTNVQA